MKIAIYTKRYLAIALFALPAIGFAQNTAWSLKDCIDYAIANSITIKQADNEVKQNKLTKETNKWARLPNLNASIGQSWNWGRSASPVDNSYTNIQTSNANAGVSTSVPLFTGLEIPNKYALSKLNLEASIADLNKAKEDLSIQVTFQYVQVLFNQELKGIAMRQIDISTEQLDRGYELDKVDRISKAELAELKSRVMQDQTRLVEADNNFKLSLLELTQMLELPTPEGFIIAPMAGELEFGLLTAPDDIFDYAVKVRPVILAAQLRAQGAEKSIKIARSAFMPNLSFSANIGTGYYKVQGRESDPFSSQISNNLSKNLGFSLSIPIFNRFSVRNQVRSAKINLNNQLLSLDLRKKELYKEIQQAWYNAVAADTKYQSTQTALESNEESFLLMKEKYELGKANNVEFNEAKINLMKAESDLLQAKYEYLFRTKILNFYKGDILQ